MTLDQCWEISATWYEGRLDEALRRRPVAAYQALLDGAGLTDVIAERTPWTARLDAAAIRALYASTIAIRRLPDAERDRVLDELERIARDDFGGRVDRPMITGLYAARRARDDSTT